MANRLSPAVGTGIFPAGNAGTNTVQSGTFTTPGSLPSNPCVAIKVMFGDGSASISSVTVQRSGGTLMGATHVVTGGTLGTDSHCASLYRLIPSEALVTSTIYTVIVTTGAGTEFWGEAELIEDVDQTNPVRDSDASRVVTAASGGSLSVSVTTAVGDLVMAGAACNTTPTLSGDQTVVATELSSDWKETSYAAGDADGIAVAYTINNTPLGIAVASFQSPAAGATETVVLDPIAISLDVGGTVGIAVELTPIEIDIAPQGVTANGTATQTVTLTAIAIDLVPRAMTIEVVQIPSEATGSRASISIGISL